MPSEQSFDDNEDIRDDDTANPTKDNPCGICRSFGLPICKGHGGASGGGGGGSGGSSSDEKSSSQTLSTAPLLARQSLDKSELWLHDDWSDSFELDSLDALMSIKLDMEDCKIVISAHDDLSEEQQKALDDFFKEVQSEFNTFKKELADNGVPVERMQCNRVGNDLTISIPNPKYYDAFVQRLIDKNILATQQTRVLQEKNEDTLQEQESMEYEPTAPTPFDMTPKPSVSTAGDEMEPPEDLTQKKIENEEPGIFNPSPFATKMKP